MRTMPMPFAMALVTPPEELHEWDIAIPNA
jgi:hypothetical protein